MGLTGGSDAAWPASEAATAGKLLSELILLREHSQFVDIFLQEALLLTKRIQDLGVPAHASCSSNATLSRDCRSNAPAVGLGPDRSLVHHVPSFCPGIGEEVLAFGLGLVQHSACLDIGRIGQLVSHLLGHAKHFDALRIVYSIWLGLSLIGSRIDIITSGRSRPMSTGTARGC
jgi:hypothetical protein